MSQSHQFRYIIHSVTILFILFFMMEPPALADNQPQSAADSDLWDFGYMPQKSEVSHTFYLHNSDTSPMKVREIKAGCSCTSISEIDKPVEPGDSAAVIVTFKSGRYRGPVSKTTKVFIDNPLNTIYEFTIKANVIKDDETSGNIKISPKMLQWAFEQNPAANDSIITITNDGADSVTIAILYMPGDILNISKLPPILAPHNNVDISIKPTAGTALSDIKGLSITFTFSDKETTIITLPIKIKKK